MGDEGALAESSPQFRELIFFGAAKKVLDMWQPYGLVVSMTALQKVFSTVKSILPKSKLSRWADFRYYFGSNSYNMNFPASNSIAEFLWFGERTKERWKTIYSSNRKGSRPQEKFEICLSCGRKTEVESICQRCLVNEEIRVSAKNNS